MNFDELLKQLIELAQAFYKKGLDDGAELAKKAREQAAEKVEKNE